MTLTDLTLTVGKNCADDKNKTTIPGMLIKPDTKSDILIIFTAGIFGKYPDYIENFGKILGKEFNIYLTELQNKGFAKGNNLISSNYQIDQQIRDRIETDNVIYISHSMGMNIAVETKNKYQTKVRKLYGICAYPSLGDTQTNQEDITKESSLQKLATLIENSNYGPFAFPLKNQQIDEPIRFAIGDIDEVINTRKPAIAKRFEEYFLKFPNSSTRLFHNANHCFNRTPYDFAPFNKDNPTILIEDIKEFIYSQ